jgi:hypothetical protein
LFSDIVVAQLNDELKAADVAWRFASAAGSPSYLQERGNRNRNIGYREFTAQEQGRLKGTRANDANAAIAQIVNATVKFLWRSARLLTRQQTPRMYFERLRETRILASFSI